MHYEPSLIFTVNIPTRYPVRKPSAFMSWYCSVVNAALLMESDPSPGRAWIANMRCNFVPVREGSHLPVRDGLLLFLPWRQSVPYPRLYSARLAVSVTSLYGRWLQAAT